MLRERNGALERLSEACKAIFSDRRLRENGSQKRTEAEDHMGQDTERLQEGLSEAFERDKLVWTVRIFADPDRAQRRDESGLRLHDQTSSNRQQRDSLGRIEIMGKIVRIGPKSLTGIFWGCICPGQTPDAKNSGPLKEEEDNVTCMRSFSRHRIRLLCPTCNSRIACFLLFLSLAEERRREDRGEKSETRTRLSGETYQGHQESFRRLHRYEKRRKLYPRHTGSSRALPRPLGRARMQTVQRCIASSESGLLCRDDGRDVVFAIHLSGEQRGGAR